MHPQKEYGLIFWIHLLLILLAYSSPWWLPWKIIFLGAILVFVLSLLFRGCILTNMQFGNDWENSFWWHYLVKIFPNLPKKGTTYFIRFYMPWILVLVAYVLQS